MVASPRRTVDERMRAAVSSTRRSTTLLTSPSATLTSPTASCAAWIANAAAVSTVPVAPYAPRPTRGASTSRTPRGSPSVLQHDHPVGIGVEGRSRTERHAAELDRHAELARPLLRAPARVRPRVPGLARVGRAEAALRRDRPAGAPLPLGRRALGGRTARRLLLPLSARRHQTSVGFSFSFLLFRLFESLVSRPCSKGETTTCLSPSTPSA